jgi:hypothetical protein
MTDVDRQADLLRMTRYYLDRSYYPNPGVEEYHAAFVLACEFLGVVAGSGLAQEAWERIRQLHLSPPEGKGAA